MQSLRGIPVVIALCCVVGPRVERLGADQQTTQQNQSRQFGPGQCGPVDPTYIQIANETGGQPFFMNPLEIANSAHIMRETTRSNSEMVLWASGTTPTAPREVKVPVDARTRRVTFSASFDTKGGDLTIVGPKGVVTGRDERTEDTISTCSRIVTVEGPQAGAWQATLMATGRFWLVVHAESDLSLETAEFVRQGGRPGHEGLFRIHGQPIAGEPATLRTRVGDSNTFKTATFALHSQDGREIKRVELAAEGDGEFVGRIDIPTQPFRVTASGVDASGLPYQRMRAGLFRGELVEVTPATEVESVAPGTTVTLTFAVRNAGPPATFSIVAVDGHGFVKRVEPQSVALDTGAVGTIKVAVSVPADAAVRGGLDITVTATSSGPRKTTNGTSRHLTIGASQAVR